jgi:drug/metabolite transporter (DMT)-like permease
MAGFALEWSWFSLVCAVALGLLVLLYTLVGYRMMAAGHVAMYMLFLMSGGMLVPFGWGLAFLDETFSWWRLGGIVCMLAGVACANVARGRINVRYLLYGVIVFVLNGFTSVTSKLHQIETVLPTVSTAGFSALSSLVRVVVCVAVLFCLRQMRRPSLRRYVGGRFVLWPIAAAAVGAVSSVLQLEGAVNLDATMLYPLITGGVLVFSTLSGWLVLKERPTPRLWVGVALCVVGTCLFV